MKILSAIPGLPERYSIYSRIRQIAIYELVHIGQFCTSVIAGSTDLAETVAPYVRFSNRPVGVKRFSDYPPRQC